MYRNNAFKKAYKIAYEFGPAFLYAILVLKMGKKLTTEEFIKKAIEIHGDKYDYSKVNYVNAYSKIVIICKEHGEFLQTPHNYITNKSGCPKCCKNHNRYTTKTFIDASNKIHKNKYDYSLVNYEGGKTNVNIICPIHGMFKQMPSKHLQGHGCPICSKLLTKEQLKHNLNDFIEQATLVHLNKYNYSLVKYENANTKIKIICPKHGVFEQTPHHHLNGHGCPKCSSSLLELEIMQFLKEKNVYFIHQYRAKWLGRQSLDFFLPDYNAAIECQGEQHFEKVYYRSKQWTEKKAENNLFKIQERDKKKAEKCINNNVILFYYTGPKFKETPNAFTDKTILLQKIKEKLNGKNTI